MFQIPSRVQTIREFKENGGLVAAVLPIHYPRELLRSFNTLPVEVWGPPRVPTGQGAVHLQPYVCSICHNALSYIGKGGLDITDLIFVPHACDSLQGLGSILIDFVPQNRPVIPIYIPRGNHQSDLEYFSAEMRSIYDKLVEITGRKPSDADLLESIHREEMADQLLARLHQENQYLPYLNTPIYQLIRSREYLPAERFSEIAQKVLAQVQDKPRQGIPVLIEGIVPEPMDIFETLSELGASVVGDDLASCGRRTYPQGTSEDPFRRMAQRILHAPPDPTRGSPIIKRQVHLLELARRTGAKGIIFYIVKFCEPELFDIPILRKGLGDAGIPTILVEVDLNTRLSQQVCTRLGAFVEMIQ